MLAWEQFHRRGDFAQLCHDPGLDNQIAGLSDHSLMSTHYSQASVVTFTRISQESLFVDYSTEEKEGHPRRASAMERAGRLVLRGVFGDQRPAHPSRPPPELSLQSSVSSLRLPSCNDCLGQILISSVNWITALMRVKTESPGPFSPWKN